MVVMGRRGWTWLRQLLVLDGGREGGMGGRRWGTWSAAGVLGSRRVLPVFKSTYPRPSSGESPVLARGPREGAAQAPAA